LLRDLEFIGKGLFERIEELRKTDPALNAVLEKLGAADGLFVIVDADQLGLEPSGGEMTYAADGYMPAPEEVSNLEPSANGFVVVSATESAKQGMTFGGMVAHGATHMTGIVDKGWRNSHGDCAFKGENKVREQRGEPTDPGLGANCK